MRYGKGASRSLEEWEAKIVRWLAMRGPKRKGVRDGRSCMVRDGESIPKGAKLEGGRWAAGGVEVGRVNRRARGNDNSVGVVLFQLGGPDSLDAIEPFLFNLFSDPDIIDFPFVGLGRVRLAGLISSRRARKVREHYASIGGRSPIGELTELQGKALEKELGKTLDARVFVAMRYWHPLTEETARRVEAQGLGELVLLPLYPQYSKATTGSSLKEWQRRYQPSGSKQVPVKIIREFYSHGTYVDAVVEKINQGLERFVDFVSPTGGDLRMSRHGEPSIAAAEGTSVFGGVSLRRADVHLVFSAHGVPRAVIEAGDPYQAQVEATTRLVMERGGWPNAHLICYQSRVGPGRWLGPSLGEALHSLVARGGKDTLVIPISFVSDHVETLSEINIEARKLAGQLGIRQFEVMSALNDCPKFIQALAELVLREVSTGNRASHL